MSEVTVGSTKRIPKVGDFIYHTIDKYEVIKVREGDRKLRVKNCASGEEYSSYYQWDLFKYHETTINTKTGRRN